MCDPGAAGLADLSSGAGRADGGGPMEQIYYTQCPVGYGLGAGNGFQIKRRTDGYPVDGDFRHLGTRPFLPGTRTPAPPVLRYRREGPTAEVVRLVPRMFEYETERGGWGRPGGIFAHGLQLDPAEFRAIGSWPAGLIDRPFWRSSDPEPTLGRPPDPVELPDATPARPAWPDAPTSIVPKLLTALALAAREGRTLYLVDEAGRLAGWAARLTLAFPAAHRADLTFSTYHDRPEELPGYRLQGTTPAARPNRPALLATGFVADLAAGTIEPDLPTARWAETLSGWLAGRSAADARSWAATEGRAETACPAGPEWSDAWLDALIGFEAVARDPDAPADWDQIGSIAAWAGRVGLGASWLVLRGAAWWQSAAIPDDPAGAASGRRALIEHASLPDARRAVDSAESWGRAASRWFAGADPVARFEAARTLLGAAETSVRPRLAAALLGGWPDPAADDAMARLGAEPGADPVVLGPLRVRGAAGAFERGDPGPLRAILAGAFARPGGAVDVLDALEAEAKRRPAARDGLIALGAEALEGGPAERWALARGDEAAAWLGPTWRRLLAEPDRGAACRAFRDRTPPPLRSTLVRSALDPALPAAAFRRAVEQLLLPLPEADRPDDPGWPAAYLDRVESDQHLLASLYDKARAVPGLRGWLERAEGGVLAGSPHAARLCNVRAIADAIRAGDLASYRAIDLDAIRPVDRGSLLARWLALPDPGAILDDIRRAWPRGFDPGAPGLVGLGRALAEFAPLRDARLDPSRWIAELSSVLARLGVGSAVHSPDGLAAMTVAATSSRLEDRAWGFRGALLRDDLTMRALAEDFRRQIQPGRGRAVAAFDLWEQELTKNPERFAEVLLNAAGAGALAEIAEARSSYLKSLDHLPWWGHDRHPGAVDDLREAFARTAPMAPVDEEALTDLAKWLTAPKPGEPPAFQVEPDELKPLDDLPRDASRRRWGDWSRLSSQGQARWRCIDALSKLNRKHSDSGSRWAIATNWPGAELPTGRQLVPLADLEPDDRHRFVARMIFHLDTVDADAIGKLAGWLAGPGGPVEPDRLARWHEELAGQIEVDGPTRRARARLAMGLRDAIRARQARG